MDELERIRFVTANYGRLQGLRKLPLRLFILLLVAALVVALYWPVDEGAIVSTLYVELVLTFITMVFGSIIFLYFHIRAYYERRYGSVEPLFHITMRRKVLYAAIIVTALNSTSFFILLMGLAMLFVYWRERSFQMHYVVMAALAISYGFLHGVGLPLSLTIFPSLFDTIWWLYEKGRLIALTFIGLYFVVGGVLDHLLLVRTMKSVPEEADGGAV